MSNIAVQACTDSFQCLDDLLSGRVPKQVLPVLVDSIDQHVNPVRIANSTALMHSDGNAQELLHHIVAISIKQHHLNNSRTRT